MRSKEYREIKKHTGKDYLTDLYQDELCSLMEESGEKPYRGRQIFSWIHQKAVDNISGITELSEEIRERFGKTSEITLLKTVKVSASELDGTQKHLFRLYDGNMVETVLMPNMDRKTVCVSSQAGCALKCSFCATGAMGFTRNLAAGEIVEQVLSVARAVGERITNIVFMGMGEPFLNYDNVIKAANILNDQKGLDISTRHITISTAGMNDKIERYLKEGHKYKLAVSISAGTEKLRRKLMPISKKYPLAEIRETIKNNPRSGKPVTFEYVLLAGLNDTEEEINGLISLVKGINAKINLIPYNSYSSEYRSPPEERISEIAKYIHYSGIRVTVRRSSGEDIQAACGQLYSETRDA
ncbi:MAG: 23S rRNA (adenine(2503)-C(2))-methyltransferase RlmN [bacterium]|nr:23S rRNA (adenine(2503)-C(2))-methyltransferase RlmN [bacterium]